jgi:CHAT domain-containing protein
MKFSRIVLALAAALLTAATVTGQDSPAALQARGMARIEHVIDQVRRAGLQPSLLKELETAATELETSYRGFHAAGNDSGAARSLASLAGSERITRILILASDTPASGQAENVRQRAEALAHSSHGHYEEAAALARKTASAETLVKALTGLALLDESQEHDYESANSRVTEAMRAALSCPNRDCTLDALQAKVEVETFRGELFSAASHVNGLLSLLKGNPDAMRQYSAYTGRSDVYRTMSEGCSYNQQKSADVCFQLFDAARADLVRASEIASKAGLANYAQLAGQGIQQLNDLRKMTEVYNSMAASVLDRFEPRTPRDVLVSETLPLGELSPAEVASMKLLRETAGPGMPGSLTTWVQAQMDDIGGRRDAALEGYLRAINMVEEDRRKLDGSSARSSFMDDKISYYERPVILLLNSKRYAELFDLLERSRARATADLLSTRSSLSRPVDRQMFAALAQKKAEIAKLQTHFFDETLASQSGDSDDPDTIAKEQTQLAESEAEFEQMLRRAGRAAPGSQDIALSQPVSLGTLQDALRQDRMDLLYYYILDNAVILIHVGPDSVHVRQVFVTRLALIRKVAALRASMSRENAEFRDDLSKQLFLYLIQPALGWLTTERLVIVPQGDLQSLPFQVFQNPADGSFLGERFEITYAPSASILLRLKRQQNLSGGPLLAAANPMLEGSREEAKALARLYPNQPRVVSDSLIRKVDLERWAGSYSILHLAVHGKFENEPLLSSISLAPASVSPGSGAGEAGDLTAAEMFGLNLDKARIVTLSACETGLVHTTRSNEIQGMQQALLFAGAQSLLVSAWKVDSAATSMWMQTFYREAQTKTPAEAAREAIRTVRRDPRYSSPFYWAPFLLIAR